MSHLALYFFGPPRIERDGQSIEIVRRKAIALLAYLAVTGQPHTREALAALLWPEYDQRRARADLRRTLSVLNRSLGSAWLNIERDQISFNQRSNYWLDITHFQRHLIECQTHGHSPEEVCPACFHPLYEAVNLFQDEFLAGFTLPDSANFDEWQFFQTERLRVDLAHALEQLIRCYMSQGKFEKGIGYAQSWLELDPLHEPAHRRLMQLYAQTNQRAAALRQYQLCADILQADLGIGPASETTALYEQIRSGSHEPQPVTIAQPTAGQTQLHNLPAQPTPFLGRKVELAEIAGRLRDPGCHLLTLTGPGGIGKTRLALEAAERAFADALFPDGVYFVPLASLNRDDFLVSSIEQALKFSFYSSDSFAEDPKDHLLNYLQARKMLLVMDNFEHLLTGSDLLVDILQTASDIKILVTSRERLNLQAEWVLEIQGMPTPDDSNVEQLETNSAAMLFLQQAHRVQSDYVLTDADKPNVARICRLVGGMPLGLQLAAAWIRQLTCREIADEIENNLDFLETSMRDMPERHRSLRAVFGHSWTRLSKQERQVYRQLSVFQGGFQRSAAEIVANASLPVLSALIDKSLLHKDESGRYEMHEVLRQYAAERLHKCESEALQARRRACDYFVEFLRPRTKALKSRHQIEALAEIGAEIENLQASWHWAVSQSDIGAIEQFIESLYHFYEMRGWMREGVAAFGRAVKALNDQVDAGNRSAEGWALVLGRVMARQGALCSRLGRTEKAQRLLQESLTTFRRWEKPADMAFALNHLGVVARLKGNYEQSQALWQESLAIFRSLDDDWGVGWSLNFLGHLTGELGDHQTARKLLEESLAIRQRIGNRRGIASALNSLGYVLYLLGEYEEARPLLEQGLAIRRGLGYRRGIAISLNYLGRVAEALDHIAESKAYFVEALKLVTDIRAAPLASNILVGLAATLAKEGELEQALTTLLVTLNNGAAGQETRDKARRLFDELQSRLSPETVIGLKAQVDSQPRQFTELIQLLLQSQAANGA